MRATPARRLACQVAAFAALLLGGADGAAVCNSSSFLYIQTTDFLGADISNAQQANLAACIAYCCSIPTCQIFMYTLATYGTKLCYAKTYTGYTPRPCSDCTVGVKNGLISVSPTPTPTQSVTRSSSASRTQSQTQSPSRTRSASQTLSGTPSQAATRSATSTRSPSNAPTPSGAPTPSATQSPSQARTSTPTGSGSGTRTPSETRTPSATITPSATLTASATRTPTDTRTPSGMGSKTQTQSPSDTHSPTQAHTPSRSLTATQSQTHSQAASASQTHTQQVSPTQTKLTGGSDSSTPSLSATASESATPPPRSLSSSGSGSQSASASESYSPSLSTTSSQPQSATAALAVPSPSGSASQSESPSESATPSATSSASLSATPSPPFTTSGSCTASGSGTPSPSLSPSESASRSATLSPSQSLSATASLSATLAQSRSPSASSSPSESPSASSSLSGSASSSQVATQSGSASSSQSPSPSVTGKPSLSQSQSATGAFTPSQSSSRTRSASRSQSWSRSPSATPSPTQSLTRSGAATASPSRTQSNSRSASRSASLSATRSVAALTVSQSRSRTTSAKSTPSPSPKRSAAATASMSGTATRSVLPSRTQSLSPNATQSVPPACDSANTTGPCGAQAGALNDSGGSADSFMLPVLGAAAGVLLLLLMCCLCALILFFCRRRKRTKNEKDGHVSQTLDAAAVSVADLPLQAEPAVAAPPSEKSLTQEVAPPTELAITAEPSAESGKPAYEIFGEVPTVVAPLPMPVGRVLRLQSPGESALQLQPARAQSAQMSAVEESVSSEQPDSAHSERASTRGVPLLVEPLEVLAPPRFVQPLSVTRLDRGPLASPHRLQRAHADADRVKGVQVSDLPVSGDDQRGREAVLPRPGLSDGSHALWQPSSLESALPIPRPGRVTKLDRLRIDAAVLPPGPSSPSLQPLEALPLPSTSPHASLAWAPVQTPSHVAPALSVPRSSEVGPERYWPETRYSPSLPQPLRVEWGAASPDAGARLQPQLSHSAASLVTSTRVGDSSPPPALASPGWQHSGQPRSPQRHRQGFDSELREQHVEPWGGGVPLSGSAFAFNYDKEVTLAPQGYWPAEQRGLHGASPPPMRLERLSPDARRRAAPPAQSPHAASPAAPLRRVLSTGALQPSLHRLSSPQRDGWTDGRPHAERPAVLRRGGDSSRHAPLLLGSSSLRSLDRPNAYAPSASPDHRSRAGDRDVRGADSPERGAGGGRTRTSRRLRGLGGSSRAALSSVRLEALPGDVPARVSPLGGESTSLLPSFEDDGDGLPFDEHASASPAASPYLAWKSHPAFVAQPGPVQPRASPSILSAYGRK